MPSQVWISHRHSTKPGIIPMKNLDEYGGRLFARKLRIIASNRHGKRLMLKMLEDLIKLN